MVGHSVRKRCRDCKRMMNGTPGRLEWCDCGGELAPVKFSGGKRKVRRAR